MPRTVTYSMLVSLDGYMEDREGRFAFAHPDDEVHAAANEDAHAASTLVFGRRMWEVMAYWLTAEDDPQITPVTRDFARAFNAAEKVVVSTTLDAAPGSNRLVRSDPVAAVRAMKEEGEGEIGVSGAGLANTLVEAGLVDVVRLYVFPVVVGGGKPALTAPCTLRLTGTRTFASGVLGLTYAVEG